MNSHALGVDRLGISERARYSREGAVATRSTLSAANKFCGIVFSAIEIIKLSGFVMGDREQAGESHTTCGTAKGATDIGGL
jgi:hypothetical protein